MSHHNRGPGPIPNRWLYCPRKSDGVIAEKFLAFKTPLNAAFLDQMPLECIFQPEMLFDYCKTIKLKLGLWIDLTNTKRFYDKSVVMTRGANYVKLQCRGHGETPSLEQTRSFIEIVDDFVNERPLDIVGVHCTHGFNRTGFLIVSYMVERLDYSVEAALAIFAVARAPGIYKQDYINELFKRYGDEEVTIQAPNLPDWCLEYDDSNSQQNGFKRKHEDPTHSSKFHQVAGLSKTEDNEFGFDSDNLKDDEIDERLNDDNQPGGSYSQSNNAMSTNGKPRKKRRREMFVENATFMDGVPGVVWVHDQPRLSIIQQKVQDMCGWEKNGFPGAQPVSMNRENINMLHERPYRVSWKADGTRYMMLINKRDEIYFIDRNNSCFQVDNLTFVKSEDLNEHLEDTLVDGEMVLDKYKDNTIPRYLIYDVVRLGEKDIGKQPFYEDRLNCIQKEIIEPRHRAMVEKIIDRNDEPFGVRKKDFWDIRTSASLLSEKFAKRLSHEPDGLIFQPSKEPYTPGMCEDVFKWKPLEMNSIDFRLKIVEKCLPGMLPEKHALLYVGGRDEPVGMLESTKVPKSLNNKIIECSLSPEGKWVFMRERTDKTLPNSYNTAKSVFDSIRAPITKEYLLEYIAHCGYREDHDKMPPPRSASQHLPPNQHHQQNYNQRKQQLASPSQKLQSNQQFKTTDH
uniref:mRNA-capping enzyme n=1 Tax=Glossina morsitans morsitans TaxID=37546 RepID=D3TNV7_GLOMM